jgi:ABC-type multidrug transport system ATPase subunit
MVSTRLRPTSGDIWVHGKHACHDVDAVRRLLNVAPQEASTRASPPPRTSPSSPSSTACRAPTGPRASPSALDAVGLTARQHDRVDTYPGGMRVAG